MKINEITYEEISRLDDQQLSEILHNLLHNEAHKYGFEGAEVNVSLQINVSDGGQDGKLTCDSTKDSVYITNTYSLFQCKATNLDKAEVYKEFFIKEKKSKKASPTKVKKELKPLIKAALDAGGQYILFIKQQYSPLSLAERLEKAKEALRDSNTIYGTSYTYDQVRILDGHQIADWVNEFIATIIKVQRFCKIDRPAALKSLDQWSELPDFRNTPFHSNENLENHINSILSSVSSPQNILRIIGHSGLGKSRLVFEALKRDPNIRAGVAYYEISSSGDQIINFTKNHSSSEGILIVDNCDYNTHWILRNEIKATSSRLSLITIDYAVEEMYDPPKMIDATYIFLDKKDYTGIVSNILKDVYKDSLPESAINHISEYSEGYPQMAVLFAKARLGGETDLTSFLSTEIIKKLIFGRNIPDLKSEEYEAIKSSSIFTNFGYPDPKNLKYIETVEKDIFEKQQEFISSKICSPSMQARKFREACNTFIERGVMERRGKYVTVRPTPLALKLAIEWWKVINATDITPLFAQLEESGLAIPLAERLTSLDQLSEAQQIVADLWGPGRPFGSAEVLDTTLGSRLFRSIVDVNPITTLQTMENIFIPMPLDELRKRKKSRRSLVAALEKLCFRKVTFFSAAKILFRFAAAENESFGNNATNQFLQLFRVFLSGTEADLKTRLDLVDYGISIEESEYLDLTINAIGSGLQYSSFIRYSGADKQGNNTQLFDYSPNSDEIFFYWDALLNKALLILQKHPERVDDVGEQVLNSLMPFSENNRVDILLKVLHKINEYKERLWYSVIERVNQVLKYGKIDSQVRKQLDSFLLELAPGDWGNKITMTVSLPLYRHQNPNDTENQKEKAELLADEIGNDYFNILRPHLAALVEGEQRQGFHFGVKLGDYVKDDFQFIKLLIKELTSKKTGWQNPDFLVGIAFNLSVEDKRRIVSKLISTDTSLPYLVHITKVLLPFKQDILDLFKLVDDGNMSINSFRNLVYGRFLDNFSKDDLVEIISKIFSYGHEGKWTALVIISHHAKTDESKLIEFSNFIKELISSYNFIGQENLFSQMDLHSWSEIIIDILQAEVDDIFARNISKHIYEASEIPLLKLSDNNIKDVIELLIENYFSVFFSEIKTSFLKVGVSYLKFKFLLGSQYGSGEIGLLFRNEKAFDEIIEFCNQNNPYATKRIAYLMPIYKYTGDAVVWHEFAVKIIDTFGEDVNVLKEIQANMGGYFIVGSLIPFYKDQINLFEQLMDHKYSTVREWASKRIEYLNQAIMREDINEQSQE